MVVNIPSSFVPTNDYVFKRIFGHVGNEEITKGLLNAILDTKVKKINLEGNTILERDLKDDKLGVLDIKAVLNNSISCDIEMQLADQENIEERIVFYWSKMYISNIHKSENYEKLEKCIAILFANFELDKLKNLSKGHTEWKIKEKDYEIILTDVLELHIISLPRLMELKEKNKLTKSEKELYTWAKFLISPEETEVKEMNKNEALKKAKEQFDIISQDEYEQRLADLRQKARMDQKARESFVRKERHCRRRKKQIYQNSKRDDEK